MTQDISDLVSYYQKLLHAQYSDKPKALATIKIITELMWVNGVLDDIVAQLWNLETSNSYMLKIYGNIVGINKNTPEPFMPYSDANAIIWNHNGNDINLTYAGIPVIFIRNQDLTLTTEISNDLFRQLIRLKLIQNFSNGNIPSMNQAFDQTFGTNNIHLINLFNMSILFLVSEQYINMFRVAVALDLLPNIAGVGRIALKNKKYITYSFGTTILGNLVTGYYFNGGGSHVWPQDNLL